MSYRHVAVYAAAAVPVGDEIDVEVFRIPDGASLVRVRHVATSVWYGYVGAFSRRPTQPEAVFCRRSRDCPIFRCAGPVS